MYFNKIHINWLFRLSVRLLVHSRLLTSYVWGKSKLFVNFWLQGQSAPLNLTVFKGHCILCIVFSVFTVDPLRLPQGPPQILRADHIPSDSSSQEVATLHSPSSQQALRCGPPFCPADPGLGWRHSSTASLCVSHHLFWVFQPSPSASSPLI